MDELRFKIIHLSAGVYDHKAKLDDSFFAAQPGSLIQRGQIDVAVRLDKSETMIVARIDISGTIELECDRTLELFDHPIQTQETIHYKLGETDQELSDELYEIRRDATHLDLTQPVYEFIHLQIPMRKIAPGAESPDEVVDEQGRYLLYQSPPDSPAPDGADGQAPGEDPAPGTDPRWDALRRLLPNPPSDN